MELPLVDGRYQARSILGRGGFGVVYQDLFARDVAIGVEIEPSRLRDGAGRDLASGACASELPRDIRPAIVLLPSDGRQSPVILMSFEGAKVRSLRARCQFSARKSACVR